VTSPFGDPSLTSDQDGASQPQPFLNDPEDRLLPGEADEPDLAAESLDNSGELTDALADAGQEAGADGKAFSAEENLIQRTSADEPGAIQRPRPAAPSPAPIPTPYQEQRDSPPSNPGRDTDLYESSGEISDVIQDARQEPGADDAALHAEDRALDS